MLLSVTEVPRKLTFILLLGCRFHQSLLPVAWSFQFIGDEIVLGNVKINLRSERIAVKFTTNCSLLPPTIDAVTVERLLLYLSA